MISRPAFFRALQMKRKGGKVKALYKQINKADFVILVNDLI